MKRSELKAQIEELKEKRKKLAANIEASTNATVKAGGQASLSRMDQKIKELEDQLESAEDDEEKPEPSKKKAEKVKRKAEPKEKPKKAIAQKKSSSDDDSFEFEGKLVTPEDVDYCEKLIAASRKRRETAKKSGKKYRTKPVMQKISANVATAVKQAIDTIPDKTLKDNPKGTISKIQRLEAAAKEFLGSFKSILGDDFDKSDMAKELQRIEKMIERFKRKYSGK